MADDLQAVVIDSGSDTCKAGFAGDDEPRSVFPSIVGKPRLKRDGFSDIYVGKDVAPKRIILSVRHPIERGVINDWDDTEALWWHAFKELMIDPKETPVLLAETPKNLKFRREKSAQILFEKFNVPALLLSPQTQLSLYASGRTTGVTLSVGHGAAHVSPFCDGVLLPSAQSIHLAGGDLTDLMIRLFNERGYSTVLPSERDAVRTVKETGCYVALDPDAEVATEQRFELPDGNSIVVGKERFLCPEALFQPSLLPNYSLVGLHQAVHDSIMKSNISFGDLYKNIVVSGGTTLLPGFADRLRKELTALAPSGLEIKIIAPPERKHLDWIGGSILASLSTFQSACVDKKEYNEFGVNAIERRFQ